MLFNRIDGPSLVRKGGCVIDIESGGEAGNDVTEWSKVKAETNPNIR